MQRVTSDTERLQEFMSTWLPEFIHAVLLITIIAVWLFVRNWFLAAVSLVSVPIMAVLTFVLVRWLRRVYHKMWRYWASLSSLLSDAIPGVTVVRAFAQEEREIGRFDHRSQAYYEQSVRAIKVHALYHPAVEFLIMAGTMVVWLYGGNMVIKTRLLGEGTMTFGVLYMFIRLLFMFYWPVRMLTMLSRTLQRAITSADRVFEVLDTEPTIRNVPDAVVKVPLEGALEFKDVWFRYEEGEPVLKDISFVVKPGEMIGLAGPSGAGKTTMVNLIARFYEVASGDIFVDGVSIKELEVRSYRDQIGMVLQDPFLFNGSIGMNIGYGKMGATREEIIISAKAANAHDFIAQLPDGYDTEVGERGVRLSGGERQRISIARAILKNPRILILDEATSSVDTETEAKIQEALERLVEDRTTFAIAHRLSTLKRATRLLILEDGKLVEEGAHEELMEKDGTYARMCKLQAELSRVRAI
jgi:ATP-binding cassette subfamily B protein